MRTKSIAIDIRTLSMRTVVVGLIFIACGLALGVPKAFAANFDPNFVLSNSNLRDYDSMTAAQVQAFLEKQPGVLDTLVTPDHNGRSKKASRIIWEACREYKISPKVMLALLQKEQSLLTRKSPDKRTLERAVGAGCPDGVTNKYPGFGNQVWNGARLLDGYGEGKTTTYIPIWKPGMTRAVANGSVTPRNLATFKLYVYNPVIGATAPYGDLSAQQGNLRGNASFWNIYRRHFGNPIGSPKAKPAKTAKKKQPAVTRWVPKVTQDTKPWTPKPKPAPRPAQRFFRYDGVVYVVTQPEPGAPPEYRRYEVPGEGARLSYTTPDSPSVGSPTRGLSWGIGN